MGCPPLQAFEAAHGNEDTFREMLRIKRSVAASFSQTHYNSALSEASMGAAAGAPSHATRPLCTA